MKSIDCLIIGNVRIDYDPKLDIQFQGEDGHCSSCIETEYTRSVTMEELYTIFRHKENWLDDNAKKELANKDSEIKKLKERIEDLNSKNLAIQKENNVLKKVIEIKNEKTD